MILFLSPPFGNYLRLPYTMPVHGSITLSPRPGKWSQILKTLRYSFPYQGWINQIGLRNPGIVAALAQHTRPESTILSIAIQQPEEIPELLTMVPQTTNLELNISCPNTEEALVSKQLSQFLHPERTWCILKVSPTESMTTIDSFYQQGFRQFHCCNTCLLYTSPSPRD